MLERGLIDAKAGCSDRVTIHLHGRFMRSGQCCRSTVKTGHWSRHLFRRLSLHHRSLSLTSLTTHALASAGSTYPSLLGCCRFLASPYLLSCVSPSIHHPETSSWRREVEIRPTKKKYGFVSRFEKVRRNSRFFFPPWNFLLFLHYFVLTLLPLHPPANQPSTETSGLPL